LTHPSTLVTDHYLDEDEGNIVLNVDPKESTVEVWTYLTAISMVWAARAVTYMQADSNSRRSYLRSVARTLGIKAELDLSPAYYLRRASAKRKVRNPNTAHGAS
jgi:hypothetical protein